VEKIVDALGWRMGLAANIWRWEAGGRHFRAVKGIYSNQLDNSWFVNMRPLGGGAGIVPDLRFAHFWVSGPAGCGRPVGRCYAAQRARALLSVAILY
jgi:hypothetical protein